MTQDFKLRSTQLEHAMFEMRRVVVGQHRVLERLMVGLLAEGHCLLEGVPGLAKTLMLSTMARVLGGDFSRIQFTPDLMPSDITGTRIYRASEEKFDVEVGPVIANFVLADEINRAPAKVQAAMLEVMQERQVTIGDQTFPAPNPFLVMATQNPIESEGVYPLPEAQRDRFLMRIPVGYPSADEEKEIVRRMDVPPTIAQPILDPADVVGMQREATGVYVDASVTDYAVRLVAATRNPSEAGLPQLAGLIAYGASPRASIGLIKGGRAMALLRGRPYVLPQDVYDIAYDVLNHRLVLSYEALADGVTVDDILVELLSTLPAPRVSVADQPSPDLPSSGRRETHATTPAGTRAPAAPLTEPAEPPPAAPAPAPAPEGPGRTLEMPAQSPPAETP